MGRAPCSDKDNGLKRGPWTSEEDQKLIDYITKHGLGNWRTLPTNAGLKRCGKSCRLRWTNYLRPDIKRGKFSSEEEQIIIHLHSIIGNKWSAIAGRLPGRTDNEIKNYWNTHIRKKLLRMGIDPVTHRPRLDLLDLSSSILYNSSQINLSRLLNAQTLANPHLLRLAAANNVVCSDNLCSQNANVVQDIQLQMHAPPPPPLFQDFQNCSPEITTQLMQQQQQQQPIPDFELENCQDYWQGTGQPESDYLPPLQNYGYYEPVDPLPAPAPANEGNHFGFRQVWSTPSSSQVNSCSTTTTTEDEREISEISNLFNFDNVGNIFYVNEFIT